MYDKSLVIEILTQTLNAAKTVSKRFAVVSTLQTRSRVLKSLIVSVCNS